jgi:hypothetical protein
VKLTVHFHFYYLKIKLEGQHHVVWKSLRIFGQNNSIMSTESLSFLRSGVILKSQAIEKIIGPL